MTRRRRRQRNRYFSRRTAIGYKIVGLIHDDGDYEIYHGRNKGLSRDIILHLPKRNGPRYRVPRVEMPRVEAEAPRGGAEEIQSPWVPGSRDPGKT